jgi:hypothetical protein
MSVESLMVHEVTLRTPSGETQNEIGEATISYTEMATEMLLQPVGGKEDRADRNTPMGDWKGFGKASIDWESWQQVVWDGRTFDIVAPPEPHTNARLDVLSHYQIDLQEVT